VELLTRFHFKGNPTNNRLRWKRLAMTNTLAYHSKKFITSVKSFILETSGVNAFNFFTAVITREEPLTGLVLLALPTNIKLGWKL
jgi:hypothetical protein